MPSQEYYQQNRSELLFLMPDIAGATVLDVGCAAGGVGKLLKEKGCAAVYGIEALPEVAAQAADIYDKVYVADIDVFAVPVSEGFFDYIVCADVLEHLKDPWQVLRNLKKLLKPQGVLVASIPNVRYGQVIGRLLRGKFGYDSFGIVDQTHLRFFTLHDIREMFTQCGFTITKLAYAHDVDADQKIALWEQQRVGPMIQGLIQAFCGIGYELREGELREFLTYQFLLSGVPAPESAAPAP